MEYMYVQKRLKKRWTLRFLLKGSFVMVIIIKVIGIAQCDQLEERMFENMLTYKVFVVVECFRNLDYPLVHHLSIAVYRDICCLEC